MYRYGISTRWLLAAATLCAAGAAVTPPADAAPQGGTVVAGSASIDTASQPRTTVITTQSDRTIMQWQSFDISGSQAVVFNQPSADSAVLNRVTGGTRTQIEGLLSSNGQVYVVNPAGVTFSNRATVNVARLVAASANLSNQDFLAGIDHFTNASAYVDNNSGNLHAPRGVVLVGRNVNNRGTIQSDTVVLIAGEDVLLQEGPDGQILAKISGIGTNDYSSRVKNTGTVDATGGEVLIGAGDLHGLAIFNEGLIRADHVTLDAGGQALTLSEPSSAFATIPDADITINADQLIYHADKAPNDRLTLNAPNGFVNVGQDTDPDLGPGTVNGDPFPPSGDDGVSGDGGGMDDGSGGSGDGGMSGGGDMGNDGGSSGNDDGASDAGDTNDDDAGGSGGSTGGLALLRNPFIDRYARPLPPEPMAASPAQVASIDAGQRDAFASELGIQTKGPEDQPLAQFLGSARILNDLPANPSDARQYRVSTERLGYEAAQDALLHNRAVFASQPQADDDASPLDPAREVRSQLQQATDRYMADNEVTELDPVAFIDWLGEQNPETYQTLLGLDTLVHETMPALGLGAAELDNFKQWTYGRIAPRGVSLRTLDELVTQAGGN